jgi:hypothetical protein
MNARDADDAARAVWYAADRFREFLWVSSPGARHSLNLAERDELSIVIFDSTQPTGSADLRLYRALVSECFLGHSDQRQRVSAEYLGR